MSLLITRRGFATIRGGSTTPLLNSTVGQFLEKTAAKREHKDVFRAVEQDYRWTWVELLKHVNSTACGLYENRLMPGKRLAVLLPNETETITSALGGARVGFQSVFLNPKESEATLAEQLVKVQPRGLIIDASSIDAIDRIVPEINKIPKEEIIKIPRLPDFRSPISVGVQRVGAFTRLCDLIITDPLPSPIPRFEKEIAAKPDLQSSFATPKATFTHSAVLNTGNLIGKALGLTPDDRVLSAVDINNPVGLAVSFFSVLTQEGTFILPDKELLDINVLKALSTESVSGLIIGTSALQSLIEHPKFGKTDFSQLKKVLIVQEAGQSVASVDELASALKSKVSGLQKLLVVHTHPEAGAFLLRQVGSSTATPLEHVELKTTDASSKDAKDGEVGVLSVKGPLAGVGAGDSKDWVSTGVKAKIDKNSVVLA